MGKLKIRGACVSRDTITRDCRHSNRHAKKIYYLVLLLLYMFSFADKTMHCVTCLFHLLSVSPLYSNPDSILTSIIQSNFVIIHNGIIHHCQQIGIEE